MILPAFLLLVITRVGDISMVQQASEALSVLPEAAQSQIQGTTPEGRTSYALAVYLFAPIAVVVPLTISTAVGAASLVGERERAPASSWPTPPPRSGRSTWARSWRASSPAT